MLRILTVLAVLVACSTAEAMTLPGDVNYVITYNIPGDTAFVIGAWGPSERGSFPIAGYETRILRGPDTLMAGFTTEVVDTFVVPLLPFGHTLDGLTFSVAGEDSSGVRGPWRHSDVFDLTRDFAPPGMPGPVTIDTSGIMSLETIRIFPQDTAVAEGFGSFKFRMVFMASGYPVACGETLLVEEGDSLVVVGKGVCTDVSVVEVDSVWNPYQERWTTPESLYNNLAFGLTFVGSQ